MKILFVVDELPYPPRNGITIPAFNHMSRLSRYHYVSLLFLKKTSQKIDPLEVTKNKQYVNQFLVGKRIRRPKLIRIYDELTMQNLYHQGWTYNMDQLKKCLEGQSFDVVWIGSHIVTDAIEVLFSLMGSKPVYVPAISDCITSIYKNMKETIFANGVNLQTRLSGAIGWIRSFPIAHIEAKILQKYNLILVQTDIEREWLNIISNRELDKKTVVVSNGVNEALFKNQIMSNSKDILFLGNLEGYSQRVLWLIENVWSIIKSSKKSRYFFIVGNNASDNLRKKMAQDSRIIYTKYVPDICEVFKKKAVSLAPVFKNYGLINKVVESMAAGVVVVGDSGSFNGIRGFKNECHGIVANGAKNMAKAVLNLLDSPQRCFDIACSARNLVEKQFLWEDRISTINENLEVLIKTYNISKRIW